MGDFGLCAFQAVLIPNELKIIYKIIGIIYTTGGYRGGEGY